MLDELKKASVACSSPTIAVITSHLVDQMVYEKYGLDFIDILRCFDEFKDIQGLYLLHCLPSWHRPHSDSCGPREHTGDLL